MLGKLKKTRDYTKYWVYIDYIYQQEKILEFLSLFHDIAFEVIHQESPCVRLKLETKHLFDKVVWFVPALF